MTVTRRINAAIAGQYGVEADPVVSLIEEAEQRVFHRVASERITAAVVIVADGSPDKLLDVLQLMETDWRDLLVAARLAEADWPEKLDRIFGPG